MLDSPRQSKSRAEAYLRNNHETEDDLGTARKTFKNLQGDLPSKPETPWHS